MRVTRLRISLITWGASASTPGVDQWRSPRKPLQVRGTRITRALSPWGAFRCTEHVAGPCRYVPPCFSEPWGGRIADAHDRRFPGALRHRGFPEELQAVK